MIKRAKASQLNFEGEEYESLSVDNEKPRALMVKLVAKIFLILARFTLWSSLRVWLYRWAGIRVGRNVFIGLDCYLDDSRPEWITIGDNVTISFRVTIAAHGFDTHGVTIRDGVYIGCGAVLLPGITIGEYSVIGAGAVVTKNVPSGSLVVGNPAKVLEDSNKVIDRRKHYLATHT